MAKSNGFVMVQNSVLYENESNLERIGAHAMVELITYETGSEFITARVFAKRVGWTPGRADHFLRRIRRLAPTGQKQTKTGRGEPTESKGNSGRPDTSRTDSGQIGDTDLILDFTDTDLKEAIFQSWNTKNIIKHREISQYTDAIGRALKRFAVDEIMEAIRNYGEIVNSDDYWFDYKWPLNVFLNGKRGDNLQKFLNESQPHDNHREKKQYTPKGSEGLKPFDDQEDINF